LLPETKLDSFVFAVVPSTASAAYKEAHPDLNNFASSYTFDELQNCIVLTDAPEVAKSLSKTSLLTPYVVKTLKENAKLWEAIHFTDSSTFGYSQYSKVLRFVFKLPSSMEVMQQHMDPLMKLVIHMIDAATHLKLSEKQRNDNNAMRNELRAKIAKQQAKEAAKEEGSTAVTAAKKKKEDKKKPTSKSSSSADGKKKSKIYI